MKTNIKNLLEENDGKLPAYAWPGGYPIYYLDHDNCILCSKCATESVNDPDEFVNFQPQTYDVYYEGPVIQCEHCNANIESAYGDPDDQS